MALRFSNPCNPNSSAVRFFGFSDQPITRDHPITRSFPCPLIFCLLLQTKHFRNSTQAPPLRHAWVALGWPKGGPGATQTQSQTQSQAGRGSQNCPKTQNATESPLRKVLILLIPITKYRSSFSSPF